MDRSDAELMALCLDSNSEGRTLGLAEDGEQVDALP